MSSIETLGLIAGNGVFPKLFIEAAQARSIKVVAVAMVGETDPIINDLLPDVCWLRVGQLGKMIAHFKRTHVREAAMAGGVQKTKLFSGARPDFTAMRLLSRTLLRRDDSMLRALAAEFERNAIQIIDSTRLLPEILAPSGVLTNREPSDQEWADLRYGYVAARHVGKLDVGQSIVLRGGAVIAIEGIEGTDTLIHRAAEHTHGEGVLVKVAKPQQDMRFDVPAIGEKTIESVKAAGIRCIGIEASRTLLLAPQPTIDAANRLGITIVGLTPEDEACGLQSLDLDI